MITRVSLVMYPLQRTDRRLLVTVRYRHLPTANREMNHRLSRQTRHQRPAARAAHGRQGQRPGDPAIRALRRTPT